MTRIQFARDVVARAKRVLTNLNGHLDALGNPWDEAKLGDIGRARYSAAIRLDAARERLAGIEAGRRGWNWFN